MLQFSNGFLLSLSLCLDIGIANIAMMTLAMQRGYFHGLWLGIGTCFGDLAYAILALAGMTVLLQFSAVRWVLWIGGGAMLVWFAVKMLIAAVNQSTALNSGEPPQLCSLRREFFRGMMLAMSSPSAILWFATVGGALISRMGQHSVASSGWFLGGFFMAGVLWTCALCLVGSLGGKLMGNRLLKFSYIASAIIFSYFAVTVIVSGYHEFIPG
ncbi:LysE family translocator [Tatumella sp. UBA2305]|uniref:LysE family translocator n=1 Tax=Tatumella sp. UBA2305 TaxID=1947647 RepID=UPI0025EAC32B|nr:LysE family transporter [Tatumella sp. UBA2305]